MFKPFDRVRFIGKNENFGAFIVKHGSLGTVYASLLPSSYDVMVDFDGIGPVMVTPKELEFITVFLPIPTVIGKNENAFILLSTYGEEKSYIRAADIKEFGEYTDNVKKSMEAQKGFKFCDSCKGYVVIKERLIPVKEPLDEIIILFKKAYGENEEELRK